MFVAEWNDDEIVSLIEKRKKGNNDFYYKFGRNKMKFWIKIANEINQEKKTYFTGDQCRIKFNNLVKDYNVSIIIKKFIYNKVIIFFKLYLLYSI